MARNTLRIAIITLTVLTVAAVLFSLAPALANEGTAAPMTSQASNGDDAQGFNWVIFLNTFTVISLILNCFYTYRH